MLVFKIRHLFVLLILHNVIISVKNDNENTDNIQPQLMDEVILDDLNNDQTENLSLNPHCDQNYCFEVINRCNSKCLCSDDSKKLATDCIKSCVKCLGEDIAKCCSCVGLCPEPVREEFESHVGDIKNNDQQLFEVLTENDDIYGRWNVKTTQIKMFVGEGLEMAFRGNSNEPAKLSYDKEQSIKNCTVAFVNRYLSITKCKQTCLALGSSHFRWFHNGCCECIGMYCFNYGINKPECDMSNDID